jgi:ssDNA thymidine ADP-ribosyltransferase DarT-like protein
VVNYYNHLHDSQEMDARVKELQCIMPVANVGSVLQRGILSHEGAAKIDHESAAMQEVQDRRDKKRVPGGLKLHQYANLYFHARNPMLYKRKDDAASLCVLRISIEVLNLKGVVITDQNAASDWVRFLDPSQYRLLDFDAIFASDWRHPNDPIAYRRHRLKKCAEVLVPHSVDPKFLFGIYVVDGSVSDQLRRICSLEVSVDASMFFR